MDYSFVSALNRACFMSELHIDRNCTDLAKLEAELARHVKEDAEESKRCEHKDFGGPTGKLRKRLTIRVAAVKAGAKQLDLLNNQGVLVNNWLLVGVMKQKWSYKNNWFIYYDLNELMKKHVTDKLRKAV
jgi:hypothetical protein